MIKLPKISLIILLITVLTSVAVPNFSYAADLTVQNLLITDIQDDEVTIKWATNSPAFYLLEYGKTIDYGLQINGLNSNLNHEVTIRGLEPSTTYHFKIISYTSDDRRSTTFDQTFKTKKYIDDEKPELLESRIPLITNTSVYFRFLTNEKVIGKIFIYPKYNSARVTSKYFYSDNSGQSNVILTSLSPSTEYIYYVHFRDSTNNVIKYNEKSFTTEGSNFELENFSISRIEPFDINSSLIRDDGFTVKITTTRLSRCSLKVGNRSIVDPNYYDWTHQFEINKLKANTTYKYRIGCTDFLGKKFYSQYYYIKTKGPKILGYTTDVNTESFGGKAFTLVREIETGRIYVLISKQKYYIRNPEIFLSYGLDKVAMKTMTSAQLAKYPNAREVVRQTSGEKFFLYLEKNMKKQILTSTVDKSYAFNKKYSSITINETDFNQYLDLWLVKNPDSPTVYLIREGVKRPIYSWDTFLNNRWQTWQIGLVNQTDLDSYLTGTTLR